MAEPRRGRRAGGRRGRRAEAQEEERKSTQYLTFALGADTFGVEIARVREILEYETPTELPMVPPFIRGVINLRGMAVPVLDLARRMGRGEGVISRRTCIVIMEVGARDEGARSVSIGVMVDGVHEVQEIIDEEVEPRPELGGDIQAEFIHGMARKEEGFLVLLNIDFVFSGADLALFNRLGDGERDAPGEIDASGTDETRYRSTERIEETMEMDRIETPEPTPTEGTVTESPTTLPSTAPPTVADDTDFPIPVFGGAGG